jgi:polar amino acid transport system substrate-binding protein
MRGTERRMTSMRKFSMVLAVAVALMAMPGNAAAQTPQSTWDKIQSSGILHAMVVVDTRPGSWKDVSTGTYHGYYVTLSQAIAENLSKVMGKPIKVEFVETTWGTVVLDLQSGKIDLSFGLGVTPERLQVLDMAGPIYQMAQCLVTRKGLEGLKTWADYNRPEIRISVTTGTTDEKSARELAPNAAILSFKDPAQTILAVQAGRADALINGAIICLDIKKKNPDFGRIIFPTPIRSFPYSASMRKEGNRQFYDFVQAWAEKNRANGTTKKLIVDALREAGLNPDELPAEFSF